MAVISIGATVYFLEALANIKYWHGIWRAYTKHDGRKIQINMHNILFCI